MTIPQDRNLRWSLDLVTDTVVSGRRFRSQRWSMTSRGNALRLVVDTSLTGLRGARELDRVAELRSYQRIFGLLACPSISGVRASRKPG